MTQAFSYGFGYDTPIGEAMELRRLVELIQSGTVQADWKVSLDGSNLSLADTALTDFVDAEDLPDINLLSGIGIQSKLSVYENEAVSHGLYVSYGALAFPVTQTYLSGDKLAVALPGLSDDVVCVNPGKLLTSWKELPQWAWLSEDVRDTAQEYVSRFEEGIVLAKNEIAKGDRIFHTFYDTSGDFLQDLLSSFSYEKMDKSDPEAVKHLYVGGRKQACQGYDMRIDGKHLTESIVQALGLPEGSFRLDGAESEEVIFRIYLTKNAELVLLEGSCSLQVGRQSCPVEITVELFGKTHSADSYVVTVTAGTEHPAVFTLKREIKRSEDGITGRCLAQLAVSEKSFCAEGSYTLSADGKEMEFEGKFAENAETLGTLSFTAVFGSDEKQWKMSLKKLRFTDASDGTYLSLNTSLLVSPLKNRPSELSGREHDLFEMTISDWEEIWERLKKGLQKFIDLYNSLF